MNLRSLKLLVPFAATAMLMAATPARIATTPVADAAQRGDLATVKKLIAQGAGVNAPQGDGMTALHWAADRGDSALAAVLLRAKANVRATTRIGSYTPLHIAARTGNPAVVRALLAAGSDVKATTTSGATALHFAAAAGNPDVVAALLGKGADPNARESAWGQTPLVFAAEFNRADAVKLLLKSGADPSIHTRVVNLSEQTAREQAAARKRNQVLISFEPPARHDSAEADYKTALAAARAAAPAGGGRRGAGAGGGGGGGAADAGAQDSASQAGALAQAGGVGGGGGGGGGRGGPQREPRGPFTPEQIQAAIDSGRAVMTAPSAATGPVREEVDTLNGGVQGYLSQVGGVGGLTALHHAVRQGNLDAVLALLDGGSDIDDTSLVDHTTPLVLALINGQFDIAMRLIERGANPNIASADGMTPLYAALNTQWAPRSRYPQPQAIQTQKTTYLALMDSLIKRGADVNARIKKQPWYFAFNNCGNPNCGLENIDGTTPFWRAAYAVDVDAMKLLMAHGADPNVSSTPPAGRGRGGRGGGGGGGGGGRAGGGGANIPGFSGPQLQLDPDVAAMAKVAPVGTGVMPIHAAAGVGYGNGFAGNSHRHAPEGWMPAMRYLVEVLHADVNARDNRGYTPLHHAAARGDNEMILYLVAHGADVKAVSRDGHTVVDMANGPVQRLRPFPETIALLEKLGAKNQHHCVSC
ncbi:MAG TPA: ankyrin repeat domain-containing protein [Gemmatimonadaceae bacterium]|nr:ankyrin repeat domain-containing protein [Gemmatimonadaceae bacterium]